MKHCVGIIAHKAKPQLKYLVKDLIDRGFEPLVHADLKSRKAIISELGEYSNYILKTSVAVSRAHISIVEASLLLMQESLKLDYDYFHLISGEDLLIKSENELTEIFEDKEANYINAFKLPLSNTKQKNTGYFKQYTVFKDQIPTENYLHYSLKNGTALVTHYQFPNSVLMKQLNKYFGKYRSYWKLYHFLAKRNVPDITFYIGSAWFSVKKSLIEYFVEESNQNRKFLLFFRRVAYPDEIYFQTLAMNSAHKSKVVNSDLRYIDWNKTVNDGPSILNLSHWDNISKSNGIFARKWELKDKIELEEIKRMRDAK